MCKVRVRAGVGGQKKQQNPGITLTGNISYLGLAYFLIITELVNKSVQSYLFDRSQCDLENPGLLVLYLDLYWGLFPTNSCYFAF